MLSSGCKKDMVVMSFCNALLITAKSDEAMTDKDLVMVDNSSHKVNNRIDRRLDKLSDRLKQTQQDLFLVSGQPRELGKWVRSKLDTKLVKVLGRLSATTNLESLATQILFNNFCERDKPVHNLMLWLTETKQYDEVYDLIEQTKVSSITESIYEDAMRSLEIIKG